MAQISLDVFILAIPKQSQEYIGTSNRLHVSPSLSRQQTPRSSHHPRMSPLPLLHPLPDPTRTPAPLQLTLPPQNPATNKADRGPVDFRK